MSGEGFIASDPDWQISDTITNRLGAIRAAEAGAGVETGAAPQGRWGAAPGVIKAPKEPELLAPRDAGEAGAEPQWRLGSAPHVIDAVHEGGIAR